MQRFFRSLEEWQKLGDKSADKRGTRNVYQRWLRWAPALIVMGTIFTASATPGNQLQNFGAWDLLVKKGGHFLGYLLLSMSFNFAIDADTPKNWAAAFSLAVLYAITDEIHQITTPGRHSSPVDVGIDSLGAAAGVGIWYWRWIHSAERKT